MPANIVLVTTCGDHNSLHKYNHSIHEYARVGATLQNLNSMRSAVTDNVSREGLF